MHSAKQLSLANLLWKEEKTLMLDLMQTTRRTTRTFREKSDLCSQMKELIHHKYS